MNSLRVESCGPGTLIQDIGRFGLRRFGVSTSGAMDRMSLATANLLAGNDPDCAAVEFTLQGGTMRNGGEIAMVAVFGSGCSLTVNHRNIPPNRSALAMPGEQIVVGPPRNGVFAYFAVSGGIRTPLQMGSRSTHPRSGIGGRRLMPGDELPCGGRGIVPVIRQVDTPSPVPGDLPVRIMLGPQVHRFTTTGLQTFLNGSYRIASSSDRMAYRLAGPKVEHDGDFNIISDGVLPGSIQIPGDCLPIVLLRDCQTTGGYPKIATVISADMDRLAQRPPGSTVHFLEVSPDQAVQAARAYADTFSHLPSRVRILARRPSSSLLSKLNLVDGVVDAMGES